MPSTRTIGAAAAFIASLAPGFARVAAAQVGAQVGARATSVGAAQQSGDTFNWSGKIPAGGWIRIRNLNGPITVSPATGDNVEVVATKRWRRGDPAVVHFSTEKFGKNDESVVICAIWGERTTCDDRTERLAQRSERSQQRRARRLPCARAQGREG